MIVGLFGISGSGKTYLNDKIKSYIPDLITTRASDLLKINGGEIKLQNLNKDNITNNQELLSDSLSKLATSNKDKTIIIELHNIIETLSGLSEINDDDLDALSLDAAIFIDRETNLILSNRKNDKSKQRLDKSKKEIHILSKKSLHKFEEFFSERKIPFLIWNDENVYSIIKFILDTKNTSRTS